MQPALHFLLLKGYTTGEAQKSDNQTGSRLGFLSDFRWDTSACCPSLPHIKMSGAYGRREP